MQKNRRNRLRNFVLTAILAGTLSLSSTALAAIQVNPIKGISPDLIKGADISILPEMERHGAKFYDTDGTQRDCLAIMQKHGVNWIRVRIWNNPKGLGGGNTDEKQAIALCQRAKALGMKCLVDLHYSDWWADPSNQRTPKAWKGHDKE